MRAGRVAVVVLLHGLAGAGLAAEAPVAVSPGSADRVLAVEERCPTFNWAQVPGATGYELVVHEVVEGAGRSNELLRHRLPAGAAGWTPALGNCLARGGRYGWSVRALGDERASDWSAPALFAVAAAPSRPEFDAALEVVRAYLADEGARDGARVQRPIDVSAELAEAVEQAAGQAAPAPGALTFPGAVALQATQEVTTGIAHGVVGTTASDGVHAAGVYGETATEAAGILGVAATYRGKGVFATNQDAGHVCAAFPHGVALYAETTHFDGIAVYADASGSQTIGVYGDGELFGGYFASQPGGDAIGAGGTALTAPFRVDNAGNVFATSFDIDAFDVQQVSGSNSADCPAGTLRTGGGCFCGANQVLLSAPNGSVSWNCSCSSGTGTAHVLCLTSPP